MAQMNRNVNLEEIDSDALFGIEALKNQTLVQKIVFFGSVILGVLFILSVFLPPAFSVGSILLLIPYIILGIWYSEKIRRDER